MEDKSQFAGFWRRVGAYLIDCTIISFGCGIILAVIMFAMMSSLSKDKDMVGLLVFVAQVFVWIISMAYHTLFEASARQATPGKMALGIVVTNAQGGRIGYGRALARNACRLISGLFLGLGYIICGFTDRRQAAHDLIAGTLVVNNAAPLRLGHDKMQIMQTPAAE